MHCLADKSHKYLSGESKFAGSLDTGSRLERFIEMKGKRIVSGDF